MVNGQLVDGEKLFPRVRFFPGARAVAPQFGHGDAELLGKQTHGLDPFEAFDFLNEFDDVATFVAAEAMEDLLGRADGEGGGVFAVEGAEALEVCAAGSKLHVALDHRNDIDLVSQLVGEFSNSAHRELQRGRISNVLQSVDCRAACRELKHEKKKEAGIAGEGELPPQTT